MSTYTIKGTITKIGEVYTSPNGNFKKQTFWIRVDDAEYPKTIEFEVHNKLQLIQNCVVGEKIEVHFNINGRIWKGDNGTERCVNSLVAWKIVSEGLPK